MPISDEVLEAHTKAQTRLLEAQAREIELRNAEKEAKK
jgi:hypothetical protein